jgi:hypothetical protein
MLSAAAAAALLSAGVPALPRGLPGDLVFARPGHAGAASTMVDHATPRSQQSAPAAVLQESEGLTSRPRTHEAASLPLDLEAWQGTLCLKGAWTLRPSRSPDEPQGDAAKQPTWQMQISPALLADGTRFLPGIGASTRF